MKTLKKIKSQFDMYQELMENDVIKSFKPVLIKHNDETGDVKLELIEFKPLNVFINVSLSYKKNSINVTLFMGNMINILISFDIITENKKSNFLMQKIDEITKRSEKINLAKLNNFNLNLNKLIKEIQILEKESISVRKNLNNLKNIVEPYFGHYFEKKCLGFSRHGIFYNKDGSNSPFFIGSSVFQISNPRNDKYKVSMIDVKLKKQSDFLFLTKGFEDYFEVGDIKNSYSEIGDGVTMNYEGYVNEKNLPELLKFLKVGIRK